MRRLRGERLLSERLALNARPRTPTLTTPEEIRDDQRDDATCDTTGNEVRLSLFGHTRQIALKREKRVLQILA
jgi:hypothetical protein